MLEASFEKKVLKFKIPAGTSRGILYDRPTWILSIWDESNPKIIGTGECAPLVNLSIDDRPDFETKLQEVCDNIEKYKILSKYELLDFPAIRIGIEMAFLDLKNGGKGLYFGNELNPEIPINGLIWMGDFEFMKSQVDQKLKEDWKCIKIKIGAIDFQREIDLLQYIRDHSDEIELRVDANGAFDMSNVFQKLDALSKFNLHSIEQPIKQGQWENMSIVCEKSPIPVGLDEELIGIYGDKKIELLDTIKPQYLVIKPTLVGGFELTDDWISFCENGNIGWWITSTLESGIGLGALRQYVSLKESKMYQGLGTGVLFKSN